MSGSLGAVGSLQDTLDRLWALEATILPAPAAGALNVYKWWRPDMLLPALWNWMTPGDVRTDGVPACRTVDVLRLTISIGVDPTAVVGEGEMLELAAYYDLARPILDSELYSRYPLGQRLARRRGAQTAVDALGGTPIITLEIPIEVELHNAVTPPST